MYEKILIILDGSHLGEAVLPHVAEALPVQGLNELEVLLEDDLEGHAHAPDPGVLDTQRGLWLEKVTFFALLLTALAEGGVAFLSGSVALFADTIHGLTNAFTTLPLWIAFALARRKPTSQFPYGYHRAEDLAGILIVLFIAASAAVVGYESVSELLDDGEPKYLPWAMAAGVVGFLVNEAIAQYRIRVGKEIGSAALVADGHHARVDGLASLAVVLGLLAVQLGYPKGDPIIGLVITGLLVYLLVREAGPMVVSRVMDRIDPSITEQLRTSAVGVPGVRDASDARARWVGHGILAELSISVDADITVAQGHLIAEQVLHELMHSIPKLQWANIHVEPYQPGQSQVHETVSHHIPDDEPTDEESKEGGL